MLISLYRVVKFAGQGFWRNIWLSLATMSIMALAGVTVNALIAINVVVESAIAALEKKIDISLYLEQSATESQTLEMKDFLEKLAQVSAVTHVTPAEALAQFRLRHAKDPAILQSLEELNANPLGATLIIMAKQPELYPDILDIMNNSPYRKLIADENFSDHRKTIAEIGALADRVNRAGVIVTLSFIFIAVLIVFNAIRMAIYTQREEIAIMKLVGASNSFITAPFVLESVLYGVLATAATAGLTFPLLRAAQPYLNNFFSGMPLDIVSHFRENGGIIFGALAISMVGLNMVGSSIAIRRYLKV